MQTCGDSETCSDRNTGQCAASSIVALLSVFRITIVIALCHLSLCLFSVYVAVCLVFCSFGLPNSRSVILGSQVLFEKLNTEEGYNNFILFV